MNLKKWLWLGLTNCLHCDSYIVGSSMLCKYCETELFKVSCPEGIYKHKVSEIFCYSLFSWERDQNRILNKLMLALKGTKKKTAWKYFARIMAHELTPFFKAKEKIVVVPCPNFSESEDHAGLFAKYLAENLNYELKKTLKVNLAGESKELNKKQRIQLLNGKYAKNHECIEKITDKQDTKVLFVDDVITTGATLLAAHEFHKEFKGFVAVSLAFRR